MKTRKQIFWALLFALLLSSCLQFPVLAAEPQPVVPEGFSLLRSAPGIEMYSKDFPGGSPDYVQVLRLDQGAALKPLHGPIAEPGLGNGVYGGADARFRSWKLGDYWASLSSTQPTAFCIANGQFFYMKEYPTRLPYPLKVDGQMLTDGYGKNEQPEFQRMLELWPGYADIRPFTGEDLYSSSAPDIIAGLSEDGKKQKKRLTGRTFIGVRDGNGDGVMETLLVFISATSTQMHAADILRSFGSQKIMMLDGGFSTQLNCGGETLISSDRLIPQALAILAAVPGQAPPTPPESAALLAATAPNGVDSALSAPASPQAVSAESALIAPPIPDQENAAIEPALSHAELPTENGDPTTSAAPPASQTAVESASNAGAGYQAMPVVQAGFAPSRAGELHTNGAALAASTDSPAIDLDNLLWVPVSMSPVFVLLFFAVWKSRFSAASYPGDDYY